MENNHLLCAIKASKIHKEITKDLKENNIIQPGKSLLEITNYIENQVKLKTNYNNVKKLMLSNGWINPMHTQVPGQDGQLSFGGKCFPKDIKALNELLKKNSH